jgi:hypothetical protein
MSFQNCLRAASLLIQEQFENYNLSIGEALLMGLARKPGGS